MRLRIGWTQYHSARTQCHGGRTLSRTLLFSQVKCHGVRTQCHGGRTPSQTLLLGQQAKQISKPGTDALAISTFAMSESYCLRDLTLKRKLHPPHATSASKRRLRRSFKGLFQLGEQLSYRNIRKKNRGILHFLSLRHSLSTFSRGFRQK